MHHQLLRIPTDLYFQRVCQGIERIFSFRRHVDYLQGYTCQYFIVKYNSVGFNAIKFIASFNPGNKIFVLLLTVPLLKVGFEDPGSRHMYLSSMLYRVLTIRLFMCVAFSCGALMLCLECFCRRRRFVKKLALPYFQRNSFLFLKGYCKYFPRFLIDLSLSVVIFDRIVY